MRPNALRRRICDNNADEYVSSYFMEAITIWDNNKDEGIGLKSCSIGSLTAVSGVDKVFSHLSHRYFADTNPSHVDGNDRQHCIRFRRRAVSV